MTDEEMTEEYAKGLCTTCTLSTCRYSKIKTCAIKESIKQACLAGLKAGRPKWHKVADGDLPKEEGSYLLYLYDKDTKSTFYEIFGVARRCVDRDDMYLESMIWTMNDVIAWCEIPTYTEE